MPARRDARARRKVREAAKSPKELMAAQFAPWRCELIVIREALAFTASPDESVDAHSSW